MIRKIFIISIVLMIVHVHLVNAQSFRLFAPEVKQEYPSVVYDFLENLVVTNRLEDCSARAVAHGEHSNLVVEVYKTLNNHATCTCTTTLLGDSPRLLDISLALYGALTVA